MVATPTVPIPRGEYRAKIVRSGFGGHGSVLGLDYEIIDGMYNGRVIRQELRLNDADIDVQLGARAELERLCRAVRVGAAKDSSELHGIPLAICVDVESGRNTVSGYAAWSEHRASLPSEPQGLQLTRVNRIELRPPDWLLWRMLERYILALIFGDPSSGKSLLAIDWACRIATGTPWRGHRTKAAPVVYVAGEGQQGLGRRIRAWEQHNGVSVGDAPLYIAPAVAMLEESQLTDMVLGIQSRGEPPALIVLDTLARCFGGGDENSTQDMSKFVAACDLLRQYYHCTVLVVHHTGHADKNRARGAIALKAALDAEYRLAKDGNLLLTATKMKDAEMPAPVSMELVTVELPGIVDEYGNPVTSAAINVVDADVSAIVSKAKTIRPRGKWQDVGFTVARRLIAASEDGQVSIDAWRDGCQAAGMVRQNQHRVLEGLVSRGDLAVRDGALSIVTT